MIYVSHSIFDFAIQPLKSVNELLLVSLAQLFSKHDELVQTPRARMTLLIRGCDDEVRKSRAIRRWVTFFKRGNNKAQR